MFESLIVNRQRQHVSLVRQYKRFYYIYNLYQINHQQKVFNNCSVKSDKNITKHWYQTGIQVHFSFSMYCVLNIYTIKKLYIPSR